MKEYIPKYSIIPLILALSINTIVYTVSKIITNNFVHFDISTSIDNKIPFVKEFIIIYILWYVWLIVGYLVVAKSDKSKYYEMIMADIIAKIICLFCFLIIPTTMVRPDIVGDDLCNFIVKFIYWIDEPVNLFPSIHCLESWIIFRVTNSLNLPKGYKIFSFIFAILVFASVVFVKQHVFIDIIGGIIVVEIGLYLSRKLNAKVVLEKIDTWRSNLGQKKNTK